jgi:hypothetical protein
MPAGSLTTNESIRDKSFIHRSPHLSINQSSGYDVNGNKMRVSDECVFYELLQENEYSDISESEYSSDSEIKVKILLGVNKVSALMKQKMSATTVACNLTYGQIQVLSDHIFHLLTSLA